MKNIATIVLAAVIISCGAPEENTTKNNTENSSSIEAFMPESNGGTYSKYAENETPQNVYWGETHLHTNNSLDAAAFGTVLTPEIAYRFARGEKVVATHGEPVQLSRPLDWLVIADHSDGLGAMKEIIAGNAELLKDATIKDWYDRIMQGGETRLAATVDVVITFTNGNLPEPLIDPTFTQSIWDAHIDVTEKYNDPGNFTAFIGYEWTSTENGNNLHRNVIYKGNGKQAKQMLPYMTDASFNPEELWKWMAEYENKTGDKVFAIPHNGNVSGGIMFPIETNPETGKPLTAEYAKNRIRWEPLYEVTQIKGDGETHPFLSPNDEFADYETWDKSNLTLDRTHEDSWFKHEYAREALKQGLKLEAALGTNPYKFGLQGATDSHTGLATAEEDNFFGKHSGTEPDTHRAKGVIGTNPETGLSWYDYQMAASGYTGIWAKENTRESLWEAMMRKEVYATTGPRMTVRFFGSWDFENEDAFGRNPAIIGYKKGVPMGGDLTNSPEGKAPSFLITALKDPMSGNLDRIQVVKGWLDNDGNTQEEVYNVAWGDDHLRNIDSNGKIPHVGNTVNIDKATYTNTIGDAQLLTVWTDPDFDASQRAFYYARVIEIPTPRWVAYDKLRLGSEFPEDTEWITTERAYTSPIWYTPKN